LPAGFDIDVVRSDDRHISIDALGDYPSVEVALMLECAGNGRTLMKPTPAGTPWDLTGCSPIVVEE
jgi:hypothetical protein